MDDLTIGDLDDELNDRLRARAAANGRSVEDEALEILRAELMREGPIALPENVA